ncbi:MAG: NTP transferase domain-containing protein, partial [Acidiphilium sp.]
NGDPARFAPWKLPVIADPMAGAEGPLAGILAGLRWAAADVISTPGDTPFLPLDLVERLRGVLGREQAEVVMASRAGSIQPVIALWAAHLADDIARTLKTTDLRGVEAYARTRKWAVANFDDGPDPFFNINTSDDLAAAEARFISA